MSVVTAPAGTCPKCGREEAFLFTVSGYPASPTYRDRSYVRSRPTKTYDDQMYEEWLAWSCRNCGYELETPVLGE